MFPAGTVVECMDRQWGVYTVTGPSSLYPHCLEVERLGHVSWNRLSVVEAE